MLRRFDPDPILELRKVNSTGTVGWFRHWRIIVGKDQVKHQCCDVDPDPILELRKVNKYRYRQRGWFRHWRIIVGKDQVKYTNVATCGSGWCGTATFCRRRGSGSCLNSNYAKLISSTNSKFVRIITVRKQCCGSVISWDGSGSADPYLWLPVTDPDSAILLFDSTCTFTSFSEIKSHKEVAKQ